MTATDVACWSGAIDRGTANQDLQGEGAATAAGAVGEMEEQRL